MELILEYQNVISFLAIFTVIALASRQIGQFFARFKLPLITGFLFTGLITGPFILGLLPAQAVEQLRFLDELSLAFIAFAAGSELYVKELRSRFKSIVWVTFGNAVAVPVLGSLAIFFMADYIPFMREMSVAARSAVSILGGAILVARSPSSAIAIVDELRAKGPFTKTVLGVTMITDLVVIILFAISSSAADALLTDLGFDGSFILLLLGEFTLSLIIGYTLGKTLQTILAMRLSSQLKTVGILIAGFGVFPITALIRGFTHEQLPFEIFMEPLLICMIGSFFVTNFTKHRNEFLKLLQDAGPPIYIIFFTLTGDALALDVLMKTLVFALILFGVRVVAIFIGSLAGGVFAGDPVRHSQVSWMAYITQAGVGLGLAKEVVVEFPEWGTAFATMIISVIVLSQMVGPPFFKWAISLANEAHPRAAPSEFDGVRDAIIFGLENQSLALARHLQFHGWQVKIACAEVDYMAELAASDVAIHPAPELTLETMYQLKMDHADAIVTLLADEESYRICELAYEHFGTKNLVVRLQNWANVDRFHKLGALIVEPGTAIVSLLDQFVRSPAAASLLLGMDTQEMVDIEVCNPDLYGIHLRDLRLPEDVLLLSVRRNGAVLVSHGYTRLERGDQVTVFGSPESLENVMLRFDS